MKFHFSTFPTSFRPALMMLSQKLNLSEIVTGVTLLAFGNSSSNVLTSLVNYRGDTEMMFAQTFGNYYYYLFLKQNIHSLMSFSVTSFRRRPFVSIWFYKRFDLHRYTSLFGSNHRHKRFTFLFDHMHLASVVFRRRAFYIFRSNWCVSRSDIYSFVNIENENFDKISQGHLFCMRPI